MKPIYKRNPLVDRFFSALLKNEFCYRFQREQNSTSQKQNSYCESGFFVVN